MFHFQYLKYRFAPNASWPLRVYFYPVLSVPVNYKIWLGRFYTGCLSASWIVEMFLFHDEYHRRIGYISQEGKFYLHRIIFHIADGSGFDRYPIRKWGKNHEEKLCSLLILIPYRIPLLPCWREAVRFNRWCEYTPSFIHSLIPSSSFAYCSVWVKPMYSPGPRPCGHSFPSSLPLFVPNTYR